MHLGQLVFRNAAREPVRTLMTVVAVAIMLTAFVFPRVLAGAQRQAQNGAPNDRVVILSKRGWARGLPQRYVGEVRSLAGVKDAVGVRWAGLKLPGMDSIFFTSDAVEARPFVALHRELVAPADQKQAFVESEASAMVSRDLAKERGWKLGQRVVFQSFQFPGEWGLTIACIYDAVGADWAKRAIWMHYDYFDRALPEDARDKLLYIAAEASAPGQGGALARSIDRRFETAPVPTLSMEDRVLSAATLGRLAAVLGAMDFVSYLILAVVLAILLNTLSLNVRERTREFGVLRAMGFRPRHVYLLVVGEAALIGLAGGTMGLAIAYPLIERLVGPALTERLHFEPTEVPLRVALSALGASVVLAVLAAALPVATLVRLEVREALGRVT
jgi:putative ABC transport system permease protein